MKVVFILYMTAISGNYTGTGIPVGEHIHTGSIAYSRTYEGCMLHGDLMLDGLIDVRGDDAAFYYGCLEADFSVAMDLGLELVQF